jgi:hypothetical protein
MTQEILNSTNNIQIPHYVSFWFRKDWTGDYVELGDIIVDAVTLNPDYLDFRSYRQGLNSLRKRLLQAKNASIGMTLNEPNMLNLQRVVFGGDVSSGQTVTVYDGRHLEFTADGTGEYFDLSDAGESDFANITVTGVFAVTDVLQATNLISANVLPDTDGKVNVDATDIGIADGETAYVVYQVSEDSMYSSEIFGASNATLEGAAQLALSPNGDLSYALDAIQNVPLLATLQERSGTFGKVYTK